MRTFTLDTNCIVAIDEGRPEASAIQALSNAHRLGRADVAVVAISASERQQNHSYLESFREFQDRLRGLDLGHLTVLVPMAYWGIAFWDCGLWTDTKMELLEKSIHEIAFPSIELEWPDFCRSQNLDPAHSTDRRWRNAKCDAQVLWSHIFNKRDIFVTTDGNFHVPSKKPALIALGAGRIEYPLIAESLI